MVSRWAFDQFSNTVWTLQWRCLTGWRFTMLCAHQRPYTGCAHRHFLHHRKQTHFRESNLRHLRLARVPVEMLTHYTNPHTVCNAHARVMEAENSITLTIYSSEHVFIALRWRSEMIMGFHEYTYQDREYIIRAMNTKHAQCTGLYIQLVTKPYTYGSSCSRLHVQLHSVILSTFVIKFLRQC